ncbi:glycosyltransferase [Rhodopseudomonas sp. BR0M22]|nr:glycosyltransferase [Rhodopseudomonas sp. BR0M22]
MRTYGVHGGERQLARLFAAEDGVNYQNTFYSLYDNPDCTAYFARIPQLRQRMVFPFRAPVFPSLRSEMLVLLALLPILQLRMLWLLATGGHRICVVHGVQAAAACWPAAWLLRGMKFVYVHRGTKSEAGSHPIFKLLYRPFDAVAGVSVATADSLTSLVRRGEVVTLENGIDWQAFVAAAERCERTPAAGGVRLISSARLLKHKAQAFLLDEFARVLQQRPSAELIIAGDGPEHQNLINQAAKLGINEKVRFIGHVPDITCRLVDSDIFVHASEIEGMSNAVLEAMTLGLPSVVVDAPGVTECHREGETGFIVERRPGAMVDPLLKLIDDINLRRKLGAAARLRVEREYSTEANAARYHALFRRLLADS